jgi:hypothetical protein
MRQIVAAIATAIILVFALAPSAYATNNNKHLPTSDRKDNGGSTGNGGGSGGSTDNNPVPSTPSSRISGNADKGTTPQQPTQEQPKTLEPKTATSTNNQINNTIPPTTPSTKPSTLPGNELTSTSCGYSSVQQGLLNRNGDCIIQKQNQNGTITIPAGATPYVCIPTVFFKC